MARKLYYKIIDDGINKIRDAEWEEILRLQHWYNSEFIWTAGRLAFKMFAVFPNIGQHSNDADAIRQRIIQRRIELEQQGLSDNETINRLESEGLIIAQKGGYFDQCLASGFTRVAGNEFNAYLVCDFLLKASLIAKEARIVIYDEGEFIKPKSIKVHRGGIKLSLRDETKTARFTNMILHRRIFSVVDATKYDQFPRFQTTIMDFNEMTFDERLSILKDWNWLGFENNFDINGDDIQGFDLNKKVTRFELENPLVQP
ncbi:MAG: hypothetical protein HYR76_09540 [Ignavibacteria bacterium]|nr:hypothetical protein [Ignavibacteria bacterium]